MHYMALNMMQKFTFIIYYRERINYMKFSFMAHCASSITAN